MRRPAPVISFVALVLTLSSAYFLIEPTPTTKLLLYNSVGALSVGAVVRSIIRLPRSRRLPWTMIALGLGSFLTADVIYYVLERTSATVPFPSVADGFYLLMYPLVGVGLGMKLRNRSEGDRDWASLIDAGIFAIALFSILWVGVMDSYVTSTVASQQTIEKFISLAYPVADIAILFIATRLAVALNRRHASLWFIVASLSMLVLADIQYGVLSAANEFETGSHVDAFWLAFYVLFGLAALLQDPAGPEFTPVRRERLTNGRLALMFVATVTVPVADLLFGSVRDRVVTLISAAVLFALVLVRALGLVRIVERSRERLEEEARRDPLTGLANRTRFAEVTRHALADRSTAAAVLFVDLDDFKTVNDSLGHAAGDDLLRLAADRLLRCVRDGDVVARLGGDEFAVLVLDSVDRNDAATVARRILTTFAEPATIVDRQVRIDASIGVAIGGEDDDVDSLLRAADAAMYLAKRQGKGRFEFFQQHHHAAALDRLDLKADLELALARREFEVYYQPIVDTDTGVIRSVEALLRWHHPRRGLVPPDRFIPLAEESGLIVPIGAWALSEACSQVRRWQVMIPHCNDLSASVNLSARQLRDPDLLATVTEALRTSGLSPEHLVLEVTESILVADNTSGAHTLEQLKALRVRVAIDDFGTGYSSLSYLHSFPVDTIKIDRSFVAKLSESSTSIALVRTVIDLARAVGGTTVAEGVENQGQLDLLSSLRCDLVQGFLYARPLAADDLAQLMRRRNTGDLALPLPGLSRRTTAHRGTRPAELLSGLRRLEPILDDVERLHHVTATPAMGRWPWQSAWHHVHPDTIVHAVIVRSADGRGLDAAAVLGLRHEAGVALLSPLGDDLGATPSIAAVDDAAAASLAAGIADLVRTESGPWRFELRQVTPDDPVMRHLVRELPGAELHPELPVPQVDATVSRRLDDVVSRSTRKKLRRARARLDGDGRRVAIEHHRRTRDITRLLPEIEATHIGRDHDRRRHSDLDDGASRRFWQEVIVAHTYTDELEVSILRIDDELAAYVIALRDGAAYRVLDGRMNTAYAAYSPGRVLEAAVLERALGDGSITTFDWMTGVAPETILAANRWQPRSTLSAECGMPAVPEVAVDDRSGADGIRSSWGAPTLVGR